MKLCSPKQAANCVMPNPGGRGCCRDLHAGRTACTLLRAWASRKRAGAIYVGGCRRRRNFHRCSNAFGWWGGEFLIRPSGSVGAVRRARLRSAPRTGDRRETCASRPHSVSGGAPWLRTRRRVSHWSSLFYDFLVAWRRISVGLAARGGDIGQHAVDRKRRCTRDRARIGD